MQNNISFSKTFLFTCVSFGCATALVTTAKAEEFAIAKNPPIANLQRGADTEGLASSSAINQDEVHWKPDITYVTAGIYNPHELRDDTVKLRAYSDSDTPTSAPFVAPTIKLHPGETFRVTLNNILPKDDPTCTADSHNNPNEPHCFNSTNMHFHGLWVNPAGNSDNVLIKVNPGVKFQYEVNIPPDHPAGTYWYHPHLHGSTALQVGSGMAGALILNGDRLPSANRPGDIDTLLRDTSGKAFKERVVLFQQIPYACRDDKNKIKVEKNDEGKVIRWICNKDDIAAIEAGPDNPYDQFRGWGDSGRFTMINGEVRPIFTEAVAGNIERWRMINAGIRESIAPGFTKLNGTIEDLQEALRNAKSIDSRLEILKTKCDGAPLERASIATDGLTRHQALIASESVMHPGYREDLLVAFPESGGYCLIDEELSSKDNIGNIQKPQQVLGFVNVAPAPEGSKINTNTKEYLTQALIAAANTNMPDDIRGAVVASLKDDLKLTAFAPHKPIPESELTGHRTNAFNIYFSTTDENDKPISRGGCSPEERESLPAKTLFRVGRLNAENDVIDCEEFSPGYDSVRKDRILPLGEVEEWTLGSNLGSHPFHIHVNPFEVISVFKKEDIQKENDLSKPGNNSAYSGLQGAWKDTLIVKENHIVTIRTRYQRYIGDFVLHCHILDHEDQGMMERVRIALPDGNGGMAKAHH